MRFPLAVRLGVSNQCKKLTMDTINEVRTKYAALPNKAAKISVNRRVSELMNSRHKTEVNRRTRDAWITNRTGYNSSLDGPLSECYALALLERVKSEKKTARLLREMAL